MVCAEVLGTNKKTCFEMTLQERGNHGVRLGHKDLPPVLVHLSGNFTERRARMAKHRDRESAHQLAVSIDGRGIF